VASSIGYDSDDTDPHDDEDPDEIRERAFALWSEERRPLQHRHPSPLGRACAGPGLPPRRAGDPLGPRRAEALVTDAPRARSAQT
jgi:hypothetical protein